MDDDIVVDDILDAKSKTIFNYLQAVSNAKMNATAFDRAISDKNLRREIIGVYFAPEVGDRCQDKAASKPDGKRNWRHIV